MCAHGSPEKMTPCTLAGKHPAEDLIKLPFTYRLKRSLAKVIRGSAITEGNLSDDLAVKDFLVEMFTNLLMNNLNATSITQEEKLPNYWEKNDLTFAQVIVKVNGVELFSEISKIAEIALEWVLAVSLTPPSVHHSMAGKMKSSPEC